MNSFINESFKMARRAEKHGDVPIGAVIVCDGVVIARGENRVQISRNPTMHAEIVAINRACKKRGSKFLDDCDIYITLEPCAMCACAISYARIRRIIFVAQDVKGGAILHNSKIFETDKHLWKPEIIFDNSRADESSQMLKDFFKKLRNS